MAWDDDLPLILRDLLQDTGTTPVYADDRLAEMVLVAARLLQAKVTFSTAYAADVSNGTLKPDPTAPATRDDAFVILVCLQAAASLVNAELRTMTRQGIEIQDGDSRIKLSRDAAALKLMRAAYEDQLKEALYAYKTGDGSLGQAVVSPYKYIAGCEEGPWSPGERGRGWGFGGGW